MKIDIKNIFGAGETKAVDVKQALEPDAVSEAISEEELIEEAKPDAEELPEIVQKIEVQTVLEESAGTSAESDEEVPEEDFGAASEAGSTEVTKEDQDPEETVEREETEGPEAKEEPGEEQAEKEMPAEELSEEQAEQETPAEELSEEQAEQETLAEESTEEVDEDPKKPFLTKDKLMEAGRKYGWLTGIAASFVILLVFLLVYTTMTPREVHAVINGKTFSFTTEAYTVERFLQDEKIEFCDEDYISVPLTTYIHDGIRLEIEHATDFTVTADGKTKKYKSLDNTVAEALKDVGVKVRKRDIVTPKPEELLTENLHIVVQRVEIEEKVEEEAVPFETVEKDDPNINEGTSKVVTEGKDGKDQVTYRVTYIDGKESERKEIARKTIEEPVDKVIANGTRINYNGKVYSKKLVVKAYAYTGGGRTAMGTKARVGEIAVDPRVIPLGTNVYIKGVGARRAEDTGGNIKGNTIDIYMNSAAECRRWGVRYVTIYIE